jgi:hypothetical protein
VSSSFVLAEPLQALGSPQGRCQGYVRRQVCGQGLWDGEQPLPSHPIMRPDPPQDQKFKEGGTLIDNSKLRRVSVDVAPPERPCLL